MSDGTSSVPNFELPGDLAGSPMASLLQQGVAEDPRTLLILNALQQATSRNSRESEQETLRARLETAARVVGELRETLRAVAAALGACPRCIGDRAGCPACGGDGTPGMRRPDPDAFERYVIPAVRRARRSAVDRTNATAPAVEVSHGLR